MPFLIALTVVAAAYGAGIAVTGGGRLSGARDLRGRATVFAAGYCALSLLALVLGQAGVFTRAALDTVAILFALVGVVFAGLDLRRLRGRVRDGGLVRRLLVATAAIVVVDVVLASAPPTSGDATAYHLTAPKLWLGAGRMFSIWWDWTTFQPFAAEMHYSYALALGDGRAAMVVGALLSGLSAVAVYGLGRELAGSTIGALAALLWVGQGMFLWEATGAFVEAIAGGLLALAAWHLAVFARSGQLADAALSGLAVGAAASTKYHALLFVPVLALVAWRLGRRHRRAIPALAAVAAGTAVCLPWYLKTWIVTGDPLYPLATGVFGGKLWTPADAAWFAQSYQPYGPEHWWQAPLFPLLFLIEPGRYERGYAFGLALFVLAPVGAFVAGRWGRATGIGLLAYLVVWTASMHQITRYLLLVMPFSALLAAAGAAWALRRGVWIRRGAVATLAVTGAVLAAITGVFAWQVAPGVAGTESTARYVQRLTGTYDGLRWLDTHLDGRGRLLVIGMRNLYWLNRPYVSFYPPLLAPGVDAATGRERLRGYDVRYVASLGGVPPRWLGDLRLVAVLEVPHVASRTLARVDGNQILRVYRRR